ncbi:MAG: ribulose-phosphate 3-epimerase [Saprospiraceae bacterium]
MNTIVAPSLLAADFSDLKSEMKWLNSSSAEWIHVDVMDGHFVPNITFGPLMVKTLRNLTDKFIDVHLMIENPNKYIEAFRKSGADNITVHYEACVHLHRVIQMIKDTGANAGISINPHTNVELLRDILPYVDLVLIMSVNPGFGGQKFIETTYSKIERLHKMREEQNLDFLIEVDGGVSIKNAAKLVENGVNVLVSGNAIFTSENPVEYIEKLSLV